MKKLPKYLSFIVMTMTGWGAFLLPFANATTLYQQLTDNQGGINYSCNAGGLSLASFVAPVSSNLSGGYVYLFIQGASQDVAGFSFNVSTTASNAGSISTSANAPTIASTSPATSYQLSFSSGSITAGTTYYVVANCSTSGGVVFIPSQITGTNFYGYVVDGGAESVPVAPGIPGFTNIGIASSSQQIYCNSSFSTSSGFLSSIASDVANGLCNVTVFLFVPPQSSLSQFQLLASTTQSRIPFSYAYQLYTDFSGLSASSTANLPTWTLSFVGFASSSVLGPILPDHLTFFSTSTISTYLPDSTRLAMLFIERMGIWVGLVFYFYRKVIPDKAKI